MVAVETKVDAKVQKIMMNKSYIISIICIALSLFGIALYVINAIFIKADDISYPFLLLFIFTLFIGLMFVFITRKSIQMASKNENVNHYEFNEDFVIITSVRNGENVGTSKFYYKDLYKTIEKKELLLLCINYASALPIWKKNFTPEDLQTVRKYLNIKTKKKKEVK